MDSFTRGLAVDGGRARLDAIAGELSKLKRTLPELRDEVEKRLRPVLTARAPKATATRKTTAKRTMKRAAPKAGKRPGWSPERRAKMEQHYADLRAAKKAHEMTPIVKQRKRMTGSRQLASK